MYYREDKARPDPAGGHQRARRVLVVDRGGDRLRQPRHRDGAVLHLLLDVRLPAGRRPRLGGGRQPRARVPARRHRRAHDAQRRGPAARGRPLATSRPALIPNCVAYDPTYNYELAVDHPRRPAADVRRAGGRLLLRHADERELRRTRRCPRAPRRGSCAGCTCCAAREDAQGAADGLGHDPARGARRRRPAAARTSASPPTSGARPSFTELRRDGMEAERWNRLHPGEEPRDAVRRRAARGPRGPGRRRDGLHPRVPRPDPRRTSTGRWSRSGTDGFGRSDYRVEAAALLRGRPPPRRRSPRCARWARTTRRAKAIKKLRDRRRRGGPVAAVIEVKVPDIGDFDGRAGDRGARRARRDASRPRSPLVTLESDKATMDVPGAAGGRGQGAQGRGRRQGLRGRRSC